MYASQGPPRQLDHLVIGAGLMAGTANVIMQLARPGVGYGVVESTVESGQVFRHPIKRTRTTLTYLAVAMLGADEEKQAYRRAVDRAHAEVHSGESSPVQYNAFDPDLQLWVAACLYKGVEDTCEIFEGPLDDGTRDALCRHAAALGATLQVPQELWFADAAAFDRYWNRSLEQVNIDETVGNYLHDLVELRFLPRFLSAPFAPFHRFVTTGFLPPLFRAQMELPWTVRQQRQFDMLMGALGAVIQRLPTPLRQFPFNAFLWDLRRRIGSGARLV